MSSGKRGGRRGRGPGTGDPISKDEFAVAKFLRFNVPTKTTTMVGMRVDYFVGSKAVDALLSSKWGEKAKKEADKLFTSREDCVAYCQTLLNKKQLFHRARKIVQSKKTEKDEVEDEPEEKPRRRKKKDGVEAESAADDKKSNEKKKKKKEDKKERKEKEEESLAEETGAGEGTPAVKEKKKKRIKLDMHEDQIFIDGNEAYVWIYDPIRPKTFVIGLLLVVGATAVCLFPLWPEWMRIGAYYLSLVAAGILGVILALSVFRYILYAFLWLASLGRIHLFLLPNLTEDVGFFDSFLPLYELELRWDNDDDQSERKKKKKTKKAKDSDAEGDSDSGNLATSEDPTRGDVVENEPSDELNSADKDENVGESVANDDAASQPSNGVASASGSDAEYEVVRHEDLDDVEDETH